MEKTGKIKTLLAVLSLAVLGAIIYSNTLHAPFVFDDRWYIADNPKILRLKNFIDMSGTRYVTFLTFAINYAIGGPNTFGYHIFNTAIHISNSILVYFLVTLTLDAAANCGGYGGKDAPSLSRYMAFFSSAIFLVHPVQTEAVSYITQRFASLTTFFYLFSVLLYVKARLVQEKNMAGAGGRVKSWALYLGSLALAVCAQKTKEISFTLPTVITLYEFTFFDNRDRIGKRLIYLLPFLLTMAIIPLSLFLNPAGDAVSPDTTEALKADQLRDLYMLQWQYYLFTQFRVIVTYLRLLVLPINQNLDYDYPVYQSLFVPGVFLSFLFLLAVFLSASYLHLRSVKARNLHTALISFGILWFFMTISIESSVIPIADVIFEHRLYLPSIGLAVSFSSFLFFCMDSARDKNLAKKAVLVVCVMIIVLGSFAAYKRNMVWKDNVTLWQDVVKKSPEKIRAYNNRGNAYNDKGLYDRAIEDYDKAISLKPDYADAYNNRGDAYHRKGLYDQAIEDFDKAISLKPDYADAYNNRGIAYDGKGMYDRAIENFNKAISLKPDYADAYNARGDAYHRKGLYDQAIEDFDKAISLKPDYADAYNNRGYAYHRKGLYDRAIEDYDKAISLKPDYADAYNNRGDAYHRKGLYDQAIEDFDKAISLKPDYALASYNRGNAYYNKGLYDQAIEDFDKAISLKPDFAEAYNNRAITYYRKGLHAEAIRDFQRSCELGNNTGCNNAREISGR